jgi:hypothetical protein
MMWFYSRLTSPASQTSLRSASKVAASARMTWYI